MSDVIDRKIVWNKISCRKCLKFNPRYVWRFLILEFLRSKYQSHNSYLYVVRHLSNIIECVGCWFLCMKRTVDTGGKGDWSGSKILSKCSFLGLGALSFIFRTCRQSLAIGCETHIKEKHKDGKQRNVSFIKIT